MKKTFLIQIYFFILNNTVQNDTLVLLNLKKIKISLRKVYGKNCCPWSFGSCYMTVKLSIIKKQIKVEMKKKNNL